MKKFLAIFFAVALMVTMLPGMAAAESTVEEGQDVSEPAEDENGGSGDLGGDEEGTEPEEDEGTEDGTEDEGIEDEGTGDDDSDDPEDVGEELEDEDGPTLLPDSPFYFLKRFVENVRLWLTFTEDGKTDLKSDLIEERARELAALEQKYIDEELTEKQIEMFVKLAEELMELSEEYLDGFVDLDAEDMEALELTEEQIAKLEKAMDNLGEAIDWLGDDEEEDGEKLSKYEKYEWRIAHLEQVQEQSNGLGLARAIENARRQQERWLARNGVADDDEIEEEIVDEEIEGVVEDETKDELDGTEIDNQNDDKDKKTPPGQSKKDEEKVKKTPPGHAIRDAVRSAKKNR